MLIWRAWVAKATSKSLLVLLSALWPSLGWAGPLKSRDAELTEWLRRHERSIILVVSKGMPYSIRMIPVVEAEASRRKIPLLKVTDQEAIAEELVRRGAMRHYPSLFLVRDHRIKPKVFPGALTAKELRFYLNEAFQ